MFAIYPGFKDLELRVEVNWRGQKRLVIARLEKCFDLRQAIIVCQFEDGGDEQWVVGQGRTFYHIGAPRKLLCNYASYNTTTRLPQNKWKFSFRGEKKIRHIVQMAFAENSANRGVVRVFYLAELPNNPRVVAESPEKLFWCPSPLWPNFVPFLLTPATTTLELKYSVARQQLSDEWSDESSDVYFSWKWASLSTTEKYQQCTGFDGDWNDLERVMKLIMQSSTSLWNLDNNWNWWFNISTTSGFATSLNDFDEEGSLILEPWNSVLSAHFRPQWREKWLMRHECVNEFWRTQGISGDIFIEQAPTAHEQLEAKLELRDWLRDKTTPDVTAVLLASLDE